MATETNFERFENYLQANSASDIYRFCFISTYAMRKLPEAFGLSVTKSWYPHFFNTQANLNYIGLIPDISQFGADEMGESERKEFLAWY